MSFKAMKFRVYSERELAEIQLVLFSLGYNWPGKVYMTKLLTSSVMN